MQNVSTAECGKAIMGHLRNVPYLIFRKLPLDSFPHSAIRIPQNTRAHLLLQKLGLSRVSRVKVRIRVSVRIRLFQWCEALGDLWRCG